MIDLGKIKQGERGTLTITWEFPDSLTSPASISAATITATMVDLDTGDVTAVTGTLTATGASTATWALSSGDSGTTGTFHVTFRADVGGVPTYTLNGKLEVEANPAATAVQNDALVGVTSAEAAWVTAGEAGGALGSAAYVDTIDEDNMSSDSDTAVPTQQSVKAYVDANAGGGDVGDLTTAGLTPTNYLRVANPSGLEERTTAQVLSDIGAAASSALSSYLPRTAGSGEALTGTLYLDPGSDDALQVLRLPVTSSDGADFSANINSVAFNGVDDTTFNWGFNVGGSGQASTATHAWFLQLEYNYNFSGANWVEYHLNLNAAGASPSFRPMQFQYKTDASDGIILFKADDFQIQSIDGTKTAMSFTNIGTDATRGIVLSGILQLSPTATSSSAMTIIGGSSVTVFNLNAAVNDVSWRSRIFSLLSTGGTTMLSLNSLSSGQLTSYVQVQVTPTADVTCLFAQGPAGHTNYLLNLRNSASAVQFAVAADGKIRTNQAAANIATPSGATAYQLPIYNAAGTLLGYIPVYGSAWT